MEDVLIVISFKSRLFPSTVLKLFKVVDNSLMAEQLEVFARGDVGQDPGCLELEGRTVEVHQEARQSS